MQTTPSSLSELYGTEYREMLRRFVDTLNEKQRRLFLGLEASRLGHGGRKLLVEEFGTSYSVIADGENQLRNPELLPEAERSRHRGAGRKPIEQTQPGMLDALEEIMEGHIAGDPMNEEVKWSDLRLPQIQKALQKQGYPVSDKTLKALLKKTFRLGSRSRKQR
jgi:hypothetical protein